MKKYFFLVIFLLLLSCNNQKKELKNKVFPLMQNIFFMKKMKKDNVERFIFKKCDDTLTYKNDVYQKFETSLIGSFYLTLNDNDICYYIKHDNNVFSNGKFLSLNKKKKQFLDFPLEGYQAQLKKKYYDSKIDDSISVFSCFDKSNSYKEIYRNTLYEVKEVSISKKQGFISFIIKKKKSNELFFASAGNGTE